MEGQTEITGRDDQPHGGVDGFTEADSQLLARELYLDAIIGVGLPSITIAMEAEKNHTAYFCGDQHNPRWAWRREKLEQLELADLIDLYMSLKGARL